MLAALFVRTRMRRRERFRLRYLLWFFSIFLLVLLLHPMSLWAAASTVEVIHSQDRYPAGHSYPILFHIRISSPLYIHGARDTGNGIIPTKLSFSDSPDLKIVEIQFPTPEKKGFPYTKQPLEVFPSISGRRIFYIRNEVQEKRSYKPCMTQESHLSMYHRQQDIRRLLQ